MPFRYLKDRHNNRRHIWNRHRLTPKEVEAVFPNVISEYKDNDVWVRECKASNGQKMKIVYAKNPDHIFIITAYFI